MVRAIVHLICHAVARICTSSTQAAVACRLRAERTVLPPSNGVRAAPQTRNVCSPNLHRLANVKRQTPSAFASRAPLRNVATERQPTTWALAVSYRERCSMGYSTWARARALPWMGVCPSCRPSCLFRGDARDAECLMLVWGCILYSTFARRLRATYYVLYLGC